MYTKETILIKFREIHGALYDYSRMMYTHTRNKIEIICPEHGVFIQSPHKHIAGSGCPKCGLVKASRSRTKSSKEFYGECSKNHNNFYTYLSDYTHSHKYITAICPIHGNFKQVASNHLRGQGCPNCAAESHPGGYSTIDKQTLASITPAFLYHITLESDDEVFEKIGVTINTERRFYEFSRYYKLTVNNITEYENMLEAYTEEQNILSHSTKFRPKIKFGGHTECIKKGLT